MVSQRNNTQRISGLAGQGPRLSVGGSARPSRLVPSPHLGVRTKRSRTPVRLLAGVLALVLALLIVRTPSPSPTHALELVRPKLMTSQLRTALPELSIRGKEKLSHTVKRGDTWGSITSGFGFNPVDAIELDNAMRTVAKASDDVGRTLQIGQHLELERAPDGSLLRVTTSPAAGVTLFLERQDEGKFLASVHRMQRVLHERVLTAELGPTTPTFAQAAISSGASYDLVDDLVDLFSDRVNFRQDFRLGDSFSIIFSEETLEDGTSVGVGPVMAAMLTVQGDDYAAIRFTGGDKKSRYFNEEGKLLGNTFLRYPVRFTRISSQFSNARFHPVLKRYRPHNGVDFAAPRGTPVRSVADGRVVYAGWKGAAGKMVKIQHSDRYSTAYLHLSKIGSGLRRGARVKRGQVIGAVGTTGRSTGPHLHYSFYDRGRYIDPMKIKLPTVDNLSKSARIDKVYLEKVLETLYHYQSLERPPVPLQEASEKTIPSTI
ncbi:MAG: peptidoglycan DD-metalloendopeptidase family protein [Bdellovibrionales bacterium]|nr:peptidoglycan DD-metalloendopeptidase family protein [Bdellovibrionales bacterium]